MSSGGGTHWAAIFSSIGSMATAVGVGVAIVVYLHQRRQARLQRLGEAPAIALRLIRQRRSHAASFGHMLLNDPKQTELMASDWQRVMTTFEVLDFASATPALRHLEDEWRALFAFVVWEREAREDMRMLHMPGQSPSADWLEAREERQKAIRGRDAARQKVATACDIAEDAVLADVSDRRRSWPRWSRRRSQTPHNGSGQAKTG